MLFAKIWKTGLFKEVDFKGFGRVLTAMVTPFLDNGEVDYDEVKRLAVHLIERQRWFGCMRYHCRNPNIDP